MDRSKPWSFSSTVTSAFHPRSCSETVESSATSELIISHKSATSSCFPSMLFPLPCLCLLSIDLFACLVAASTPQHILTSGPILRNATVSDAAAIVNVLNAAFDPSPPFQYRYQFKDKYPVEHWRCTYESILQAISVPFFTLQVIVLPGNRGLGNGSLVSVAGWVDRRGPSKQDWNPGHSMSLRSLRLDQYRQELLCQTLALGT